MTSADALRLEYLLSLLYKREQKQKRSNYIWAFVSLAIWIAFVVFVLKQPWFGELK